MLPFSIYPKVKIERARNNTVKHLAILNASCDWHDILQEGRSTSSEFWIVFSPGNQTLASALFLIG